MSSDARERFAALAGEDDGQIDLGLGALLIAAESEPEPELRVAAGLAQLDRLAELARPALAAEPDAAAIDQIVQTESERIRTYIEPLIDTRAVDGAMAGIVNVTMFHDVAFGGVGPGGGSGGGPGGGVSGEGFGLDEGLMKYVGLSGLALISLAMMFLMVRKATTHEELPSAEELVGIPPALGDSDLDLIGEAEAQVWANINLKVLLENLVVQWARVGATVLAP